MRTSISGTVPDRVNSVPKVQTHALLPKNKHLRYSSTHFPSGPFFLSLHRKNLGALCQHAASRSPAPCSDLYIYIRVFVIHRILASTRRQPATSPISSRRWTVADHRHIPDQGRASCALTLTNQPTPSQIYSVMPICNNSLAQIHHITPPAL